MSHRLSRLPLLLLLAFPSFARAIPDERDFDKVAEQYQHAEWEKQLWLKPARDRIDSGDFVARLSKEAAAGNVDSQATLALCLYLGFGTNRNVAKAVEWYRKAGAAGHAGAQNNLGELYDSGTGVSLDHKKAFELYLKAARRGFVDAEFNVALQYATGEGVAQDWEQARLWYTKAAEQGSLAAMTNLGNIYLDGRGVPVDLAKARSYLQKPAEAGGGLAQNSLGVCAREEKRPDEAASWFERSAQNGFPLGEYQWAEALGEGIGVQQDRAEALKWARKAAANPIHLKPDVTGDAHALIASILDDEQEETRNGAEIFSEAKTAASLGSGGGEDMLGICYRAGIGVTVDAVKAVECFRRGAELKDASATTNLGFALQQGVGVAKDPVEAAKCFRFGTEKANPFAMAGLAKLYLAGEGMKASNAEAVKWLAQAYAILPNNPDIINDYCEALVKLGQELETAQLFGPPPNFAEAAKSYRIAAELGQPYAQYRLGLFYRDGAGVKNNLQEAVKWLRLAAQKCPDILEFQANLKDAESQLTDFSLRRLQAGSRSGQ